MKLHKLFLAAMACLLAHSASYSQQYGLEVEILEENIGLVVGALGTTDLTDYARYRVYITTVNDTDFVSSVSGDMNNPTYITTTTSFFHAPLGGSTPNGINPLLFGVYPDLVL